MDETAGECDKHRRAVESLEAILLDNEEISEDSGDSMADSEDFDEDIEMNDEIEDSTTLGQFQEG